MDIEANRAALEAWLILLRAPGLGAVSLRELLAAHGDARAALAAARRGDHPRARDSGCRDWLRAPDAVRIESDLAWLAQPAHALLTCDGVDFPALLDEVPAAPAALFVAGDSAALWQPQVAIVGSRNATQGGSANADAFARALATAGFAITSGLAEGIDTAAHVQGSRTSGSIRAATNFTRTRQTLDADSRGSSKRFIALHPLPSALIRVGSYCP